MNRKQEVSMAKDKAKDDVITKKKEDDVKKDDEKEFAGKDMAVEGTKDAVHSELTSDKPLTISDMLPGLRAKGMRI